MASAATRLLESSNSVFAALEGRFAQGETPTDEEDVEAAVKSPDEWDSFAADLASKCKASQLRLGQPLDRQVASAAFDLWECPGGPATEAPAYQPVAPYLVAIGKGNVRRLTVEMAAGRPSPSPSGSTRCLRRTPRPRTGTPSTVESAGLTTCRPCPRSPRTAACRARVAAAHALRSGGQRWRRLV